MRLRRWAIAAQGLNQRTPFGRGRSGAAKAINALGYVQIDTISVVHRAHHHVLRSRVPNYKPDMLDQLIKRREVFEYWAHAAAFLPINDYRFSLPYKKQVRDGKVHWFKNPDQKLMKKLMQRIESEGALKSKDVEQPKKSGGWWEWKPAKRALEHLYFRGDLMVSARDGFQKSYDLPERVLPKSVDTALPTYEEYAQFLINQTLNCHGLVSLKGISYLRRDAELRQAVKQQVDEALSRGELVILSFMNMILT